MGNIVAYGLTVTDIVHLLELSQDVPFQIWSKGELSSSRNLMAQHIDLNTPYGEILPLSPRKTNLLY